MNTHNIDLVTSFFEASGAVLAWVNVRSILRDRKVQGIWWPGTLLFLAWGGWALFYYPHVGMPVSQAALAVRLTGNTLWVALVVYFKRRST